MTEESHVDQSCRSPARSQPVESRASGGPTLTARSSEWTISSMSRVYEIIVEQQDQIFEDRGPAGPPAPPPAEAGDDRAPPRNCRTNASWPAAAISSPALPHRNVERRSDVAHVDGGRVIGRRTRSDHRPARPRSRYTFTEPVARTRWPASPRTLNSGSSAGAVPSLPDLGRLEESQCDLRAFDEGLSALDPSQKLSGRSTAPR